MKSYIDQPNEIPALSDLISEYFTPREQIKKPKKKWWQFWRKAEAVETMPQGPRSKYKCHMWHCLHYDQWVLCNSLGNWCANSHSCELSFTTFEPVATDYLLLVDDIDSKIVWHDGTEISAADPDFFAKLEALMEATFNEVER